MNASQTLTVPRSAERRSLLRRAVESRLQQMNHGTLELEFGGRVEFRLGRFSIQISDFWGFDDFP